MAVDPAQEALVEQLRALEGATLSLTPLTDSVALVHQIARVHQHFNADVHLVVLKLAALQQLALLAKTDERMWKAQVTRLWPKRARELISNRRRARQCAGADMIGLWISVAGQDGLEDLCDELYASESNDHETATQPPVDLIPVRLNLVFMGDVSTAFSTVESLALPPLPDEVHNRRNFRIANVGINTEQLHEVHSLCQLVELATLGVAITDFPHLYVPVTPPTAAAIASNLQTLLATRSRRINRTTDLGPIVNTVKLVPRANVEQDQALLRLISATGDSASVREVSAIPHSMDQLADPNACATLARWLAFSLFSSESRHRIRRFELVNGVRNALARQSIEEILTAGDPVAAMFPALTDSVARHAHSRLSASKFTLYDPTAETSQENASKLTNHPHKGLRVLSQTAEWWSVVLPGWGQAWVRHTDATVATAVPSPNATRHWIPEMLVWMRSSEEMAQSLAWLAFGGTGVKQVELSGSDLVSPPITLHWHDAVAAFPNVNVLRLTELQVDSLKALADVATASTPWRIRWLTLKNVTTADPTAGVAAFLDALSDSSHVMNKTLTSLVVDASRPPSLQAEIMAAALRMLSANRQLQSFTLQMKRSEDAVGVDYEAMRRAFAAHHNKSLHTRLREKLALLSVATQCHGGVLQSLDSRIFADIFRLAGLCQRRSVELIAYA